MPESGDRHFQANRRTGCAAEHGLGTRSMSNRTGHAYNSRGPLDDPLNVPACCGFGLRRSRSLAIVVYNTLTRREKAFSTIDTSNVRMYVCGPTVYDLAHIGNARPVVVFDLLYRLLKRRYPRVTYVRNITDVEDKINAAARANGESIRALTERTAKAFHEDMAALIAVPPDHEPRDTEHIDDMIAMIQTLIESGHAYVADGHVLFSVPSMPEYGTLSRRNRGELVAGARVEVAPYKKDPADF